MNRGSVNALAALTVILVLFIPVAVGWYGEEYKETVILSAQPGDFYQLGYVGSNDPLNQTNVDDLFESPSWTINHYETVNDSALIGTTGMWNKDIAYLNTVIDVGNTTVITGVNYSLLDQSPDYYFYELEMNTHDITAYDYFIIETFNCNHTSVGLSDTPGSWTLSNLPIANTNITYSILGYNTKATLLADDPWPIYVVFSGIDIDDPSWSVEVSYYELSDTVWSWGDSQLFGLSVVGMIAILAFTIALNTDSIDLKIDRNRKDRK